MSPPANPNQRTTLRSLLGTTGPLDTARGDGVSMTVLIPLGQITDNPYQPRKSMDPDQLEELALNIRANDLIEPIVVAQTSPDEYVCLVGHRRRAAFALLHERAADEVERNRWGSIRAEVRQNVSDVQMRVIAASENLLRSDLNAVERADSIAAIMEADKLTKEQLSTRLGLKSKTIQRYLRLSRARPVIKDACTKGIMVPVLEEDGATPTGRERRTHKALEFHAALEFQGAWEAWAASEEKPDPKKLDERLERVLIRALRDDWTLERIEGYCAAARTTKKRGQGVGDPASSETGEGSTPAAPSSRTSLYRQTEKQLVVFTTRCDAAPPADRAALAEVLKDLMARLSSAGPNSIDAADE